MNNNRYDISSIKSVTRKFLEVSRCGRAKQRQRNVQKKCAARAKLFFANQGDVKRDDSQRRFLVQHSVEMLEQCCNHSKERRNKVAVHVALKIVLVNRSV